MFSAFEIHTEFNGKLTRVYIGRKTTVWFSYETPIAFAVAGAGTFKSENIWTSQTAKHLNSIPAHTLSNQEFNDRLAVIADGFDSESQSTINRPSWTEPELLARHGESIRKRS
jgi:hypothetical protein